MFFNLFIITFIFISSSSLVASSSSSSHIPALFVFGDSTVDAGNNNYVDTLLKSNFKPYGKDFKGGKPTGRFCNGRLATDFISEALGLPSTVNAYLDPNYSIKDFAKGVCFASAGTGLDNMTSAVLNVIPLWKEVEFFKEYQRKLRKYVGRARAKYIVNEAIYIISIGTNDFLENYYLYVTGRASQFTVDEYEDFLIGIARGFLTELYWLGARKISFSGLGPIGCVPLERTINLLNGRECVEEYNKVARDFNVKLAALIKSLCASLPGLKLRLAPIYDGLLKIIQNPALYGFEVATEGCCATGTFELGYLCDEWSPTCEDANKYVFWDSIHPSEKMNHIAAINTLRTSLAEFI